MLSLNKINKYDLHRAAEAPMVLGMRNISLNYIGLIFKMAHTNENDLLKTLAVFIVN